MRPTLSKRLFSAFVAITFTVHIASWPQQARAFFPAALMPMVIGLEIVTLMGVGAAIEMYDGLPEPSKVVGQKGLSLTIKDANSSNPIAGQSRIPLTNSADSEASITPPPAATTAVPDSRRWRVNVYYMSEFYSTKAAACQAWIADRSAANTDIGYVMCESQNQCRVDVTVSRNSTVPAHDCQASQTFNLDYVYDATGLAACPDGYYMSGSLCILNNARQAQPDGKTDYKRNGNAFEKYVGDDSTAVDSYLTVKSTNSSNDTISLSGRSPNGQPRTITVTNTANGGSVINAVTQKTDASQATYLETKEYTVSPSGVFTGATSSNTQGRLTADSTTGSLSPTGSGTAVNPSPTDQGGAGCGAPGQPKCAMDDSSFNGLGQYVNGQVDGYLETSGADRDAMTGAMSGTGDGSANIPDVNSDWFPSFRPEPYECSAITFNVAISHGPANGLGGSADLDVCEHLTLVRDIMGFVFYILAAWYIYRSFFYANKAT